MERRLNLGEKVLWMEGTDSFSIAVSVTLRGSIIVNEIREAIKKARLRHPLMGVRIALDRENIPWFVSDGVPNCPLRLVDRTTDTDVTQEIKNELATPFAWEVGPLVRFTIIRSHETTDLIITCHHCVTDGIGMAILLRDIFDFLLRPDQKVEIMPDQPPLDDVLPDYVKGQVPHSIIFTKTGQAKFQNLTPIDLERMHHSPKSKINRGNLQIHSWALGEQETTAFLARCRKESLHVHSAISAAFGMGGDFKDIATAVSIRNRAQKPIGDRFGVFAAAVIASLRQRPGQNFWEVARHYQKQFQRHLQNIGNWVMFLPAFPASFTNVPENMPEYMTINANTLTISNLGDLSAYGAIALGKWKLVRITGAVVAPSLNTLWLGLATFGGKMWFNILFWDAFMNEIEVKGIVSKAMGILKAAINAHS